MTELELMLSRARDAAACGGIDGRPEIHLYPGDKHQSDCRCWCDPELHYVDPATKVQVYQHREIQ